MKPLTTLFAAVGLASAADNFPTVAYDVEVALFAKEPLVRNPCGIASDQKGPLCVAMGPQYRKPKPDTPGDLDSDDEADEYVRLYPDLGNLEHGLHGLNWGPDGKLYLSKGNSKYMKQP